MLQLTLGVSASISFHYFSLKLREIKKTHQNLVAGFNPSEKYESQLGGLFPIYGKIKFMFQTTNQQKSLTSFFCTPSTQDAGALQDDGALIVVHVVYKRNKYYRL
jgi:hypothetical protein